jgi:hypothetical protein
MAEIAILIPHKRAPENDKALTVALDCIARNTDIDYELLIDATTPACPYEVINRLARAASAEYVVFANSDVFFAPGWAEPMLAVAAPNKIVTGVLVEPGAIGVNERNAHFNFGMTPDRFDREAFEAWVAEQSGNPTGVGWFFPSLHHRETFLSRGGFDPARGRFPEPLDKHYWNQWQRSDGQIERVASYAYHLQNWSNPEEQAKAVRYA